MAKRRRMTKREIKILDDNQVRLVRDKLHGIFPPEIESLMEFMGINCEEMVRWMPLAMHQNCLNMAFSYQIAPMALVAQ
jgi:hypothetical protein